MLWFDYISGLVRQFLLVCKGGHGIEWDGHVGREWDGIGWDGNPTVIFVLPIPSHSHPIANSYPTCTCSHITDKSPLPSHLLPIPALAQLLPSQPRCQRSYSRPMGTLGARLTHPNRAYSFHK